MPEKNILLVLGQSHAIKILESLNEKAKRFVELEECCKSNRTRADRLKELEGKRLIKKIPQMKGGRAYTFYEITPRGKEALTLCRKLLEL